MPTVFPRNRDVCQGQLMALRFFGVRTSPSKVTAHFGRIRFVGLIGDLYLLADDVRMIFGAKLNL
jgi:hypothetical protein